MHDPDVLILIKNNHVGIPTCPAVNNWTAAHQLRRPAELNSPVVISTLSIVFINQCTANHCRRSTYWAAIDPATREFNSVRKAKANWPKQGTRVWEDIAECVRERSLSRASGRASERAWEEKIKHICNSVSTSQQRQRSRLIDRSVAAENSKLSVTSTEPCTHTPHTTTEIDRSIDLIWQLPGRKDDD